MLSVIFLYSKFLNNSLRLKSQNGAFQLCKARCGGSGLRELIQIECPQTGYDIQAVKEEARASTIYIVPLNENIDESPVSINDISTNDYAVSMAKCSSCDIDVPLSYFAEHKLTCTNPEENDKDFKECRLYFMLIIFRLRRVRKLTTLKCLNCKDFKECRLYFMLIIFRTPFM